MRAPGTLACGCTWGLGALNRGRGGRGPARGRLDAAGGGSQAAVCPSLGPTHP